MSMWTTLALIVLLNSFLSSGEDLAGSMNTMNRIPFQWNVVYNIRNNPLLLQLILQELNFITFLRFRGQMECIRSRSVSMAFLKQTRCKIFSLLRDKFCNIKSSLRYFYSSLILFCAKEFKSYSRREFPIL